jgi:hypothetical protein
MPDPHEDQLADLSALVLGGLPADQEAAVREHLGECPICQAELPLLEQTAELLAAVEAEAFLDGPPENAEFLIARTVRAIREQDAESSASAAGSSAAGSSAAGSAATLSQPRVGARGRVPAPRSAASRSPWLATAAAFAMVIAVGAGAVVGRLSAPGASVALPTVSPAPTPAQVPGTRVATNTDPATGARLSVQVIPAVGWIRINAAAAGIGVGQRCRLVVVDRAGRHTEAGSWLVTPEGAAQGTTLQGSPRSRSRTPRARFWSPPRSEIASNHADRNRETG